MAKILTVEFHIKAYTKAHLPNTNLFFLKAPCNISRCAPNSTAGWAQTSDRRCRGFVPMHMVSSPQKSPHAHLTDNSPKLLSQVTFGLLKRWKVECPQKTQHVP